MLNIPMLVDNMISWAIDGQFVHLPQCSNHYVLYIADITAHTDSCIVGINTIYFIKVWVLTIDN